MAKREAVLRNLGGQQVDNNNNSDNSNNSTEVQHCYVNVDSKKLPPSSQENNLQLLKITVAEQVLVEVTLATEEKGKVNFSSRGGRGQQQQQQQQQQKVMRVKVKEL